MRKIYWFAIVLVILITACSGLSRADIKPKDAVTLECENEIFNLLNSHVEMLKVDISNDTSIEFDSKGDMLNNPDSKLTVIIEFDSSSELTKEEFNTKCDALIDNIINAQGYKAKIKYEFRCKDFVYGYRKMTL